jgi:hypothetical protein
MEPGYISFIKKKIQQVFSGMEVYLCVITHHGMRAWGDAE